MMQTQKFKAATLALLLLIICIAFSFVIVFRKEPQMLANSAKIRGVHKIKKDDFTLIGISEAKSTDEKAEHIRGGIVPHHLLASKLIAEFFVNIKNENIDTVFLIGPNHPDAGESKVITSEFAWETSFGSVQPHLTKINKLLTNPLVSVDEEVIGKEHSITGIIPFVSNYLPHAQLVPLILKSNTNISEIQLLSTDLSTLMDETDIVVTSVDFSHYLKSSDAFKNDEVTLSTLISKDYEILKNLDNDFVDSPESIILLSQMMDLQGVSNLKVLYHTNSAEILNNDFVDTTSYFTIYYD